MEGDRLGQFLRRAAVEALDLATPQFCAGCGALGAAVCEPCAQPLYGPLLRVRARATDLPIWAAAPYADSTRLVVQAWKRGRVDVAAQVLEAVATAADRWAAVSGLTPQLVVPAPSGWRRRLSGRLVARDAAGAAAARVGAQLRDPLRRRWGVTAPAKLAGASARRRAAARTARTLRVVGPPPQAAGMKPAVTVLLVDDVVTTGATLAAAAAVLEEAWGVCVVGALVLAAAPSSNTLQCGVR